MDHYLWPENYSADCFIHHPEVIGRAVQIYGCYRNDGNHH